MAHTQPLKPGSTFVQASVQTPMLFAARGFAALREEPSDKLREGITAILLARAGRESKQEQAIKLLIQYGAHVSVFHHVDIFNEFKMDSRWHASDTPFTFFRLKDNKANKETRALIKTWREIAFDRLNLEYDVLPDVDSKIAYLNRYKFEDLFAKHRNSGFNLIRNVLATSCASWMMDELSLYSPE